MSSVRWSSLACSLALLASTAAVRAAPPTEEPQTPPVESAPPDASDSRGEPSEPPPGVNEPAPDTSEPTPDVNELPPDESETPPGVNPDVNEPSEPSTATTSVASDEYPDESPHSLEDVPAQVRYFLERVEVQGNTRTRERVVRSYVPFEDGAVIAPDDPQIEAIEWRLRGTGWFSDVSLSLERGERRGWVVLVVEVVERNTIIVSQLTLGISEGLNNSADMSDDLMAYGGATVAETNLFGTGAQLALSGLGSARARGVRLAYEDPRLLRNRYSVRASGFYLRAREYFGNDPLVSTTCSDEVPECAAEALNAVVLYRRGGISIGTGRDLGASTRLTLDWQGEVVDVRSIPDAASETRGSSVAPIDFAIQRDVSYVSVFQLGLTYDRRDDPGLPTRGIYFRFDGDLGTRALRSDYDFLRLQILFRAWVPLPHGHTIRFGVFAGAILGDAPFFYLFHVSDLTDLIPSRYLEMQLDRRRSPNFFGTSIEAMLQQELATRLDVQYELPLFRGRRGLRALNAYVNVGLLALANTRDLTVAIPGYQGFSKLPVDLTVDLGLRFDTRAGVFQLGFSNLLGFIEL